MEAYSLFRKIQEDIAQIDFDKFIVQSEANGHSAQATINKIVEGNIKDKDPELRARILAEFNGLGPLESLLADDGISEILFNDHSEVWIERNGKLERGLDSFFSESSFRNCVERILKELKKSIHAEQPFLESEFREFRLTLLSPEITKKSFALSIRKPAAKPWTLEKLVEQSWSDKAGIEILLKLFNDHENFLVVGNTGSGKTSFMNAILQKCAPNERVVTLEDTSELRMPNCASLKLLTRSGGQGHLPEITYTHLLQRALRLRPDRIVVGEIRGAEAKDFLMAMATGHRGSFGTIHADHPQQALIRLEMLISMGAPQWNLLAIRRLISMSLKNLIVLERKGSGERILKGVYRIQSLEENGFTLDTLYSSQN